MLKYEGFPTPRTVTYHFALRSKDRFLGACLA